MFDIYKTSKATRIRERVRAVLLGSALFFPAFLFSLPFTMVSAKHLYAGDGQGPLAGIGISFWFGIVTAVIGCTYLVGKVNRELRDTKR